MKKTYIKPVLAVEHYELTQTIATCITKVGFADANCVRKDPDVNGDAYLLGLMSAMPTLFAGGCEHNGLTDNGDYNGICYHTSVNAAFTS